MNLLLHSALLSQSEACLVELSREADRIDEKEDQDVPAKCLSSVAPQQCVNCNKTVHTRTIAHSSNRRRANKWQSKATTADQMSGKQEEEQPASQSASGSDLTASSTHHTTDVLPACHPE